MNEMRARMGYRYAAIVRRPQHFQFCAQILEDRSRRVECAGKVYLTQSAPRYR